MLDEVAREISALPTSDRRAILAALGAADRERLQDAMRSGVDRAPPVGDDNDRHSAWMNALIAAAHAGDDARMTDAARKALLDAAGRTTAPARPAGRSLLSAAGSLLTQPRMR